MKNSHLFLAAAVLGATPLSAQTPPTTGIVYQQARVMSIRSGPGGPAISFPANASELFSGETVTGRPLSATHESHSLQVLGDGTRIEGSESQQVYRDSMGRTRVETGPSGTGPIMIQDPVNGVMTVLDPATKTAQKMEFSSSAGSITTSIRVQVQKAKIASGGGGQAPVLRSSGFATAAMAGSAEVSAAKPAVEDLPAQNVNGVIAAGRRTSLTIAAGEIGNDRPIQVVGETWYSSDLQMMVKSSNSDPRFGDTTYELTNINRAEPDPSLFQVPGDYAVSDARSIQVRTGPGRE